MTHLGPLTDRELNSILTQVRGKDPGLEKAVDAEMQHRAHLRAITTRGVSWWRTCWKTLAVLAAILAAVAWWLL